MTYVDEWQALSSRIRGVMQAGELHARFLGINRGDTYARAKRLREHCEKVLNSLESYCKAHKDRIPVSALASINDFVSNHGGLIRDVSGNNDSVDHRVWAALVMLGGLESEISYALSDVQEVIRVRSERAFAHLQRSIVADPDIGAKWLRAFEAGEVACEKLGGTHLLLHGIFAFKVNAEGERTDLVFPDILNDLTEKQRYADGFILTEWKKAKDEKEAGKQFAHARAQAARYASGVLGGTELGGYRYLVVVTRTHVTVPGDIVERNVTYRHINIAVSPQPPSKQN